MKILMQYIGQNYITLMLLLGIIIVMSANRHAKLDGTKYIYAIIAFVFILTISEYAEYLCDTYNQSVRILYAKAAVSYLTEPLLVILELCLILPHKHSKLLFVPYFIESALVITDLFGTELIYGYHADHSFISGPLHFVPAVVLCFYIIMLMQYSIEFIQQKDYSKAMIVIFISFTTMITVFLEYWNIITDHTTDIAAFDILIYYFYLAAIHHSRVQDKLHKSRLELEHRNNELLMAQIQPHFINNSLMAIQARCMDNPEVYDSIKNFSRYLRSNFDNIGNPHPITFEQELRNIKAYLSLEKMNFGDRLKVEYDIDSEDFLLPALSVEPLVENAVRHGVAARENGGIVRITQRDEEDGITIDVRDIGFGKINLTEKQEKRRGIGVANVRARLSADNKGMLELIPEKNGFCARIVLRDVQYMEDKVIAK